MALSCLMSKSQDDISISQKVAREKIKEKDLNSDGKLSLEEYFDAKYTNEELKKRFARQDLNGDGILIKSELTEYSNKIWSQINKQANTSPPWDSSLMASKQIQSEDQNKDQKISFEEYIQANSQSVLKQNTKRFDKKDKNKSGFLEEEEVL